MRRVNAGLSAAEMLRREERDGDVRRREGR